MNLSLTTKVPLFRIIYSLESISYDMRTSGLSFSHFNRKIFFSSMYTNVFSIFSSLNQEPVLTNKFFSLTNFPDRGTFRIPGQRVCAKTRFSAAIVSFAASYHPLCIIDCMDLSRAMKHLRARDLKVHQIRFAPQERNKEAITYGIRASNFHNPKYLYKQNNKRAKRDDPNPRNPNNCLLILCSERQMEGLTRQAFRRNGYLYQTDAHE
jgi:glycerophosphoryl diester phosphodiesterase